jgi:transposase
MQTTEYTTKRIDHLGIVAGICNKIGLIETIDEQVGEDDRKVSVGQAVQAMVLNGLGFVGRPLYLTPEFFANKPVEVLIGPEIEAADLNDDSLGRALDRLFETGVTELFAAVAGRGLSVFEIGQRFRHLDSTTFSLHGQYDRETDERAIEITHGYSKDHRPDLKQTVLALICSQQSAIPSWLAVLNGNQSDNQSFVEIIQAYRSQLEASHDDDCYYVADSALYSADNIQTLSQVLWLTRVPATLKAVKQLYRQVDPAEMQAAKEAGYRFRELGSSYGQVRQRWVLVFSEAAYQREVTTLNQHIAREQAQASQALRRLAKQEFDTAAAAQEALAQPTQSWRFHQIEGSSLPSVPHYDKPGRPRADQEPDYFT